MRLLHPAVLLTCLAACRATGPGKSEGSAAPSAASPPTASAGASAAALGSATPARPPCPAAKEPLVLAAKQKNPGGLAFDADYVYWLNGFDGTVMRVSRCGGRPQQLARAGPAAGGAVTLFGEDLYWIAERSLFKVAKSGGTPVKVGLGRAVVGVESDGMSWIDDAGSMKLPAPGAAPVLLTKDIPSRVGAFDRDSFYWGSDGLLWKMPRSGGKALELLNTRQAVGQMRVDADNLYWAAGQLAGEIMKLPKSGGEPIVLAPHQALTNGFIMVGDLALDADDVYWSELEGSARVGRLQRVPKAGGGAITLASHVPYGPMSIAVVEGSVYFTAVSDTALPDGDKIMKLDLPASTK